MQQKSKHIIAISLGALVLVALSAGASALIMRQSAPPEKPAVVQHYTQKERVHWNPPAAQPAPQAVAPSAGCDDNNIVGTAVGGIGGGVAGSQVGKGSGKTAATIAGTLGGAYLGNELIPTRNVTCR